MPIRLSHLNKDGNISPKRRHPYLRILTEIISSVQVLFSLSFSKNLFILIIEILFFHSKPRIRQLALFFPSNTSFKHRRKRVQRFLSSFNDKIFKVIVYNKCCKKV